LKNKAIREIAHEVLKCSTKITIRKVAVFLGKITSSLPAAQHGRLNYRAIERDKIMALRHNKDNFEAKMTLSEKAKKDVTRWAENVNNVWNVIHF